MSVNSHVTAGLRGSRPLGLDPGSVRNGPERSMRLMSDEDDVRV